jgi:hypothetical protein
MISSENTVLVRVNGVPFRMPHDEMQDPRTDHHGPPSWCGETEPDWPDGQGGTVVCTLAPHPAGPSGTVHIARGGQDEIIAVWGTPALVRDDDY